MVYLFYMCKVVTNIRWQHQVLFLYESDKQVVDWLKSQTNSKAPIILVYKGTFFIKKIVV